MPDREFIHSTADVASTLLYALDSGLQIRLDDPQPEPRPCMLTRTDVAKIQAGVFFLFRPEWVFGQFQFSKIGGGHNRGKYDMQPGVNYAPITAYFHGERTEDGLRKFGGCLISWDRDWLEMPAKVVRATPPDVGVWYKRFVAHLSSGVTVKAGVHNYRISKGVLSDPNAVDCLPPFDYIPWGNEVLRKPKKKER